MTNARADVTPDVAVIGAGIVGVSVAAHLAAAGTSVTVYETEAVAAASSGRNSGVVQQPLDPLLGELYQETLEQYRELAGEAPEAFALPADPAGLLLVGGETPDLRAAADDMRRSHPQLDPQYLAPGEVTRLEPAVAADVAAIRLAIGYPVAPAAATRAMAARAERLGTRFEIGRAVRPWVRDGRAAGVLVDGQAVAAGTVVVAAGPWSAGIVDPSGEWTPIRPLWGVVVEIGLTDPPRHVLEEADIDVEPGGLGGDADGAGWRPSFSLVPAGTASTLGSTFLAWEPDRPAIVPRLIEHGAKFVPGVAGARVGASRACARPLSLDGRPLIGRVPSVEGLWIAAGHGPWGISTGPASGRLLADLIRGRVAAPPPALDPARFGASPRAPA